MDAPCAVFRGVPVSEVLQERQRAVVSFDVDDNTDTAVTALQRQGFLSAPVYDGGECVGLLDVLDCVHFALSVEDSATEIDDESWRNFAVQMSFSLQRVGKVVGISKRNPFCPVKLRDPLSSVMELFAKGIHRVCVVDDTGKKVTHLITQSDLCTYIVQHAVHLGPIATATVQELDVMQREVVCAPPQMTALEVFRKIDEVNVSGVALVAEDGTPIGNLSASDLAGFLEEDLPLLNLPAIEFLRHIREKQGRANHFFVSCEPSTEFISLVRTMCQNRVHRCFVVDDKKGLAGVVSMTDVFRILLAL